MRPLVCCGGMRIGDTFMLAPGLRDLAKRYRGSVDLVHGKFQTQAIKFLKDWTDIPIAVTHEVDEGKVPADWGDIERFPTLPGTVRVLESYPCVFFLSQALWAKGVDQVEGWALGLGLPGLSRRSIGLNGNLVPCVMDEEGAPVAYIAAQGDTISDWKRQRAVFEAFYPLPVVSLGFRGEAIVPGSSDMTGVSWATVINVIAHAKLFVGIASSLTKLASMVGTPTIMCHFGKEHVSWSGVGREPGCLDLLNPSTYELTEAIRGILNPD